MTFDVIVIGGGHAGCEAACAAARFGAVTALVTHRFATVQLLVQSTPGLCIVEGAVAGLIIGEGRVAGVTLKDGRTLSAGQVVLTTGTFLNGMIHVGPSRTQGGRVGEPAAMGLSEALAGTFVPEISTS